MLSKKDGRSLYIIFALELIRPSFGPKGRFGVESVNGGIRDSGFAGNSHEAECGGGLVMMMNSGGVEDMRRLNVFGEIR